MIDYTPEQIQEIKALRLAYISREIGADEYELEMAIITAAANRSMKVCRTTDKDSLSKVA